jgi:uncharacterized circularly permuted ATP-grasp superfamily protein
MSTALSIPNPTLLDGYAGLDGVYDELRDAAGRLRPHWQRFCELVGRLGPAEFSRRWDQAQTLLRENGIAFSAYGDPDDKPRPWELDPLPVLLPAAEWQQLGQGLTQRARLLDLVLADLYGPQHLLADGWLPAELLYRHPGFHRALHGQRPAGGRFLHVYAADLARAADGRWWLLADRTESPSGVGYALENRIVVSRMLPEVFHPCQVERLAPYFIALRQALAALASPGRDDPRMVLLSEGAGGRNYFEDAYVARYLGYGLVESGDLAVRREQTMLKTLGGLLPVDVIVRRPNTEDCDPLELAGDGAAGVTGWTQSVRSRRVAVVNLLGAGLVESPAFLAFLPQLCRRLLGEELLLPNVATWWCGDPQQRQYVLAHLDQLTIRPAFRRRGRQLETKLRLSHLTPAELAAAIRADGGALVAQQFVDRSTADCHACPRLRGPWISPRRSAKAARIPGSFRTSRFRRSACYRCPARRYACAAAGRNCPAGWPTTCSGWDGRPNGPRPGHACCAPRLRGWPANWMPA